MTNLNLVSLRWSTDWYINFKIFTSKTVWWNIVLLLLYVHWGHFFVLTCGVLYKLVGLGFQVLVLSLMTHCSHSQVVNSGFDFCVMSVLGIFKSIIYTLMNGVNLSSLFSWSWMTVSIQRKKTLFKGVNLLQGTRIIKTCRQTEGSWRYKLGKSYLVVVCLPADPPPVFFI